MSVCVKMHKCEIIVEIIRGWHSQTVDTDVAKPMTLA